MNSRYLSGLGRKYCDVSSSRRRPRPSSSNSPSFGFRGRGRRTRTIARIRHRTYVRDHLDRGADAVRPVVARTPLRRAQPQPVGRPVTGSLEQPLSSYNPDSKAHNRQKTAVLICPKRNGLHVLPVFHGRLFDDGVIEELLIACHEHPNGAVVGRLFGPPCDRF